jgi:hypothetical protein
MDKALETLPPRSLARVMARRLPSYWPSGRVIGTEIEVCVESMDTSSEPEGLPAPVYPVLLLSPSGFPPLLLAAIGEELASMATSWWA